MDIILVFLAISLLGWFFFFFFKKNRKNAKKEFKDAVKGGLGAGIVYLIIFVAFIAVVCLLFFIHVKLNYAD